MTHRGGGDPGGDRLDGVAVVEHPELVAHPLVVVGVGGGTSSVGVERGGQAVVHREAPNGREVGPRRPQEVEPVALGLGQRPLVGQYVALMARFGQSEGSDHPRRRTPRGVGHPVGVEARDGIRAEGAVALPAHEEVGGHPVAVAPGLQVGFGQLDAGRRWPGAGTREWTRSTELMTSYGGAMTWPIGAFCGE